jgi:hypothetical protein
MAESEERVRRAVASGFAVQRRGPGLEYLQAHGSLTNRDLLCTDGLNVKRSSLVCALLARLPGVHVASARPITLRLTPETLVGSTR